MDRKCWKRLAHIIARWRCRGHGAVEGLPRVAAALLRELTPPVVKVAAVALLGMPGPEHTPSPPTLLLLLQLVVLLLVVLLVVVLLVVVMLLVVMVMVVQGHYWQRNNKN